LAEISFETFCRTFHAWRWQHPFVQLTEYLISNVSEGSTVSSSDLIAALNTLPATAHLHLAAETNRALQQFQEQLTTPAAINSYQGYLSDGFAIDSTAYVLFPLTIITGRYKIRRQKLRTVYHTAVAHTLDLKPGDLVVHLNNGIGKFLGFERRNNSNGLPGEFLHLAYADNATLYVPIQQAHLVTKYIGASDQMPTLHNLGSGRWKKVRENTQKAIVGYAKELLNLYAQRQLKNGNVCPPDGEDMCAFEEEFPFVETEDQLQAIQKIKDDLTSTLPMDRLVCGDVGYGKTEVAMRAAFKAVVDGGKQVAVLVPTTVLAMQHYENFCERMRNFPVNIGILSRFRSSKQIKETLQGVSEGSVDIVIGTHRIIGKDVVFKDLGLIIIDEEQRFGVRAKEHLKKAKVDVDCLTLSATPIPRTLYMALVGARDMSVINTPPEDRLPISTLIAESTDEVLRNALMRELARDGQAYVIHNRIDTIYGLAERISILLPHARIAIAHGQMDAHELDTIFHNFRHGTIDILLATTIIENGIDVPNANTILIDQADHYGLSTLYQMRGRVGRWNRRAYAYLLIKARRNLREEAQQRLQALINASGYGGGIKVAMRDLEIRGAGDLLGTEQSGHVAAIGFHFYCKLLKRAIDALQGLQNPYIVECKLEFPIDARLPDSYIEDVSLRLEIYQRLGDALTCQDIDTLWSELRDRFGPPPPPACWLYHLSRLRLQAAAMGYVSVKWEKMTLIADKQRANTTATQKFSLKPCNDPALWEQQVLALLSGKPIKPLTGKIKLNYKFK
jgi:transcription-repair coupling factor (superfamily II helicase)